MCYNRLMTVGNDISSYQGQIDWPTFKNNINFIIAKATEGIGLIDAWYGNNRQQARDFNIPRGWYHFAHPELNSPEDEANWLLKVCYDIQPGEILFLDYEPLAGAFTGNDVDWVTRFFKVISDRLSGYKAVFYSFQNMLTRQDWSSVVKEGHGLWVAAPTNDPNNNNFDTGAWPFAMMQQWGNETVPGVKGVVDADVFFGTDTLFKAYGYHLPNPTPAPSTNPDPTPNPVTPTEPTPTPTVPPIPTVPPVVEPPVPPSVPPTDTVTIPRSFLQKLIDLLKSWLKLK